MEEILPQRPCGAGCHIVVEKKSTEFLSRAENLPTTRPAPAVIPSSQAEQLERACQRPVEPLGSLRRPRCDRAIHRASHVRQLLVERERCAASLGHASL